MTYRLQDYDYPLDSSLIATQPARPRGSSRLMVIDRKNGRWQHTQFSKLREWLAPGDWLIGNNSLVIRARLLGKKTGSGGKVEFLLLKKVSDLEWEGLIHCSAPKKRGLSFEVEIPGQEPLVGELTQSSQELPGGVVRARFNRDPGGVGEIPLPQYILHERTGAAWADAGSTIASDTLDYQTVFSKVPGSSAAPTAGLHFSKGLISQLETSGIHWREITLHVGLGTFRPVSSEDIREHRMHEEEFEISSSVAQELQGALARKERLIAVGTTSLRTLESAWQDKTFRTGTQRTGLFIYPGGHSIQVVSGLITNFHFPRSSLLMLVCAFAGRELIMEAYAEAMRERYRFYSYGDAMLIL